MLNFAELTGQTQTHLQPVPSEQHSLQADTAAAYQRLKQAASEQSINMNIASGFRSLERQLAIWNRKWRGELPLLDKTGSSLDVNSLTNREKLTAILHWSALPGASRHHWGTDFDIYDARGLADSDSSLQLIPAEYCDPKGPCYNLWVWLSEHAREYGFFFPYARYQGGVAQEPWHLSYRPVANKLQQQLTVDALIELIRSLEIEGQSTILEHINDIYKNYINNICEDNGWTNTWCGSSSF